MKPTSAAQGCVDVLVQGYGGCAELPSAAVYPSRLEERFPGSRGVEEIVVFCDNLVVKKRIVKVEEPTHMGAVRVPWEVKA